MSALGQKQTFRSASAMSALLLTATIKADIRHMLLPSVTEEYNYARRCNPSKRVPWNKGKLVGTKPPLRQKHVWAIRTMLQVERSKRDLAMFNLAIDSKLRGCDVVAIRVDDVATNGHATTAEMESCGDQHDCRGSIHRSRVDYVSKIGACQSRCIRVMLSRISSLRAV